MRILELFNFLNRLKNNNSKVWFDENRSEYQDYRDEFIVFITEILVELTKIDTRFGSLNPSKCIFRINRDIRFSKNKDPYKTNFGMNLNLTGKKEEFCGFYLHLEPGSSFFAGGMYLPQTKNLQSIRQEIDYNAIDFKGIVEEKKFVSKFGIISGEKLIRPPKGYDADNEMIEYLKMKSFIAESKLIDSELNSSFLKEQILNDAKLIMPLNDFLLRAINQ
jgi:uncharacterized protein (TIGR02453 family)